MTQIDNARQLQYSVKKDDQDGYIQFIMPSYMYPSAMAALPIDLPGGQGSGNSFYNARDLWQLYAPRYEGQWATAVGKAVGKMSALSWEVDSDIPARRKRAQQWLLQAGAGMGLFGWVPFLSMTLRSYLATGYSFIEIERESAASGSRVRNIHHLNPLRCRLSGDPQKPVYYLDSKWKARPLWWYQVMVLVDLPDPTEGEYQQTMSATERAWKQIIKLAALEGYVYEKISGQRPLSLYFVNGMTGTKIQDAVDGAREDASRKNLVSYMGAAIVPMMADITPEVVEIPLASLPDGFNANEERQRADLIYANSIGLDPQDLNPQIVGRQGLGSTGNQAQVLDDKEKGGPLAAWRQQLMHNLNELALDDKTTFTFTETDLRDQKQAAENAKLRNDNRKVMIDSGMITPEQARNLAVDDEDLPPEFLDTDITQGGTLTDTQKPDQEPKKQEDKPGMPDDEDDEKPESEAEKEWTGMY